MKRPRKFERAPSGTEEIEGFIFETKDVLYHEVTAQLSRDNQQKLGAKNV